MLIWLFLFLIIVGISFVLAFRSMSDYRERPFALAPDCALFLVGKPDALTPELLNKLYGAALQDRLIIALERLFKGSKRALVVFGPSFLLKPLIGELELTEIEDYSLIEKQGFAWEMGKKGSTPLSLENFNLFKEVPKLEEGEEFWWQVVLQPKPNQGETLSFDTAIRGVFKSPKEAKLPKFEKSGLTFLPQAYSSSQILKFYQERSLPKTTLFLPSDQICSLLGI